jgi:hypothetical protein
LRGLVGAPQCFDQHVEDVGGFDRLGPVRRFGVGEEFAGARLDVRVARRRDERAEVRERSGVCAGAGRLLAGATSGTRAETR